MVITFFQIKILIHILVLVRIYLLLCNVTWIDRNLPTSLPRSSLTVRSNHGCLYESRDFRVKNTRPKKLKKIKLNFFLFLKIKYK